MRDVRLGPIVAGTLLGTLGYIAVGLGYVVAVLGSPWNATPLGELQDRDVAILEVIALILVGLGAFVAAQRAGGRYREHGGLVGVFTATVWILSEIASPPSDVPFWLTLVSTIGMLPMGVLGGYIAERANQPVKPTARGASAP